jgi:hypothetical protein
MVTQAFQPVPALAKASWPFGSPPIMKFPVAAVREPPLRLDFHGKACGYQKTFHGLQMSQRLTFNCLGTINIHLPTETLTGMRLGPWGEHFQLDFSSKGCISDYNDSF